MWTSHSYLLTRIRLEGLLFDVLGLLRHLGLLSMVLATQQPDWYRQFAASYAVVRLVGIITGCIVTATLPRARAFELISMGMYAVMAVLAVISIFISHTAFYIIFGIIVLLEALSPLIIMLIPAANLPLNVAHADERVGLLLIV